MRPTLLERTVIMYLLCHAAADEEIKRLVSMLAKALTYAEGKGEAVGGEEKFWEDYWNAVTVRLFGSGRFELTTAALVTSMRPLGWEEFIYLGPPTSALVDRAYALLPVSAHRLVTMDLLWSVVQTTTELLVPELSRAQLAALLSPDIAAADRPSHTRWSEGARSELLRILVMEGRHMPIVIACLPDVRQQIIAALKLALIRGDRMCSSDVLLDILDPGEWECKDLLPDSQTKPVALERRQQILAKMISAADYDPLLQPAPALSANLRLIRKKRLNLFSVELLRIGHALEEVMNQASYALGELIVQARSALGQLFPACDREAVWPRVSTEYQTLCRELRHHYGESFSHGSAMPLFRLSHLLLADRGTRALKAAMDAQPGVPFSFTQFLSRLVAEIAKEGPMPEFLPEHRHGELSVQQSAALNFFVRHARAMERVLWVLIFLCSADDPRSIETIAPVFFADKADPCTAAFHAIHKARIYLWEAAAKYSDSPPPSPSGPGTDRNHGTQQASLLTPERSNAAKDGTVVNSQQDELRGAGAGLKILFMGPRHLDDRLRALPDDRPVHVSVLDVKSRLNMKPVRIGIADYGCDSGNLEKHSQCSNKSPEQLLDQSQNDYRFDPRCTDWNDDDRSTSDELADEFVSERKHSSKRQGTVALPETLAIKDLLQCNSYVFDGYVSRNRNRAEARGCSNSRQFDPRPHCWCQWPSVEITC